MNIELEDPATVAGEAAALLRRAWAPPCLHYTEAYLRWQLSFPGPLPPLAVAAREGGELVGFAGATLRPLRTRELFEWGYLVSFVAVQLERRGQGIARELYGVLLEAIRNARRPLVAFATPGSPGERALRRALGAAGLSEAGLGAYPAWAFALRGTSDPAATRADSLVLSSLPEEAVLSVAPDPETLRHYAADPRPRVFLKAERDGRLPASASAGRAEVFTATGVAPATILDILSLPEAEPELLRALCSAAALAWLDEADRPSIVSVPNATPLQPEEARAAGLRRTGPGYSAWLAAPHRGHPFLTARATSLEVA